MKLSHAGLARVVFDDPNLVSSVGLVPMVKLTQDAGLTVLPDKHPSVPTDRVSNSGLKVLSLIAGMVAGADSIDDMAVLRHGGMRRIFESATTGTIRRKLVHIPARIARSARRLNSTYRPDGQATRVH